MSMTAVTENDYKMSVKTGKVGQIAFTNATTRKMTYREMVVAPDANDKHYVGYIANPDGLAAAATGLIDLYERQEVATAQFTAAVFVPKDTGVFIVPQTNLVAALITQATATGSIPLNALIVSYLETGTLKLLMPVQDGSIVAAS